MTIQIFIEGYDGNYTEIDYLDCDFVRHRDFDTSDSFRFTAGPDVPIPLGHFMRAESGGRVIYRGAVRFSSGSAAGPVDWICESIQELVAQRFTGSWRWGAPAIVSGYEALTLGQVLSDSPPSQSAGTDQYIGGALWMAKSLLSVTPDEISSTGVRKYTGWGTNSVAGSCDVYVGGRLCTEIFDLSSLGDAEYRFYRNPDALYIYGAGIGDYGPYCLDGSFDYGLRLGDIDRIDDRILAAIDVNVEDFWKLIRDLLYHFGLHIKLRHTKTLTYIDASINPYERGSPTSGAFILDENDWITLERSRPDESSPSVIIGLGEGEGITRVRSSVCNPNRRGPWVELLEEVTNGKISPAGQLDKIVSQRWYDLSTDDNYQMSTAIDYLQPGDWVALRISPSEIPIVQIDEISQSNVGPVTVHLGGKKSSVEYAFFEYQESEAVAVLRSGQIFATFTPVDVEDEPVTAPFGVGTPISVSFTPETSSDQDIDAVYLKLECDSPDDSTQRELAVTYTVKITNTSNPGGLNIAVLRNMPWGESPVFEKLNIIDWCDLDGTEETVEVSVTDPWGALSETLDYMITIDVAGRSIQTPKTYMQYSTVDSSTLDGNYYVLAVRLDPATGRARAFIKSGGTKYYTGYFSVTEGNSPQVHELDFATNPATGSAWTQETLDDLQAGIEMEVNAEFGLESGAATFNLSNTDMPSFIKKATLVFESEIVRLDHWYVRHVMNDLRVDLK